MATKSLDKKVQVREHTYYKSMHVAGFKYYKGKKIGFAPRNENPEIQVRVGIFISKADEVQ